LIEETHGFPRQIQGRPESASVWSLVPGAFFTYETATTHANIYEYNRANEAESGV
jgi:hypothetical protein